MSSSVAVCPPGHLVFFSGSILEVCSFLIIIELHQIFSVLKSFRFSENLFGRWRFCSRNETCRVPISCWRFCKNTSFFFMCWNPFFTKTLSSPVYPFVLLDFRVGVWSFLKLLNAQIFSVLASLHFLFVESFVPLFCGESSVITTSFFSGVEILIFTKSLSSPIFSVLNSFRLLFVASFLSVFRVEGSVDLTSFFFGVEILFFTKNLSSPGLPVLKR